MKIIALDAENVKRLKAVHIEPDGAMVVIGGKNAQGKTSVLDSIMYALGGKKKLPKKALRDGQKRGFIKLELDDDLVVTRTFTESGGGELRVESKGAIFRSPQTMLEKLVGKLGFDPMQFDMMDPAKRLEQLKNLVGLDFVALDRRRLQLFEDRATVNRDLKATEGTLSSMERKDDAPEDEISVSDLTQKLTAASAAYQAAVSLERTAQDLDAKAPLVQEVMRGKAERIREIEDEIGDLAGQLEDLARQAELAREDARKIREKHENPGVIKVALQESQGINAQVRVNQEMDALEELLDRKQLAASALTKEIEAIDTEKEASLSAADFPVDGLGFGDGEVTFGGQPWEQCALSERIRVSVGMGFAMNPKLRVLLIRDGSGLDADNLALVAELAEKANGQLFIERVGDQDQSAVIIEDGMIQDAPKCQECSGPIWRLDQPQDYDPGDTGLCYTCDAAAAQ